MSQCAYTNLVEVKHHLNTILVLWKAGRSFLKLGQISLLCRRVIFYGIKSKEVTYVIGYLEMNQTKRGMVSQELQQ